MRNEAKLEWNTSHVGIWCRGLEIEGHESGQMDSSAVFFFLPFAFFLKKFVLVLYKQFSPHLEFHQDPDDCAGLALRSTVLMRRAPK